MLCLPSTQVVLVWLHRIMIEMVTWTSLLVDVSHPVNTRLHPVVTCCATIVKMGSVTLPMSQNNSVLHLQTLVWSPQRFGPIMIMMAGQTCCLQGSSCPSLLCIMKVEELFQTPMPWSIPSDGGTAL